MSALSVHLTRTVAGLLVIMSMVLTPASVLAAPPDQGGSTHVVQAGETLYSIASRYGVTVEAIMAANDLTNANYIYVGQRLIIPGGSDGPARDDRDDGWGQGGKYVVKAGDTLTSIALRYGTTVGALATANGLNNADYVYVGQVLNVPGESRVPEGDKGKEPGRDWGQAKCEKIYAVRAGDTLSSIAWQHRTTVNELIRSNDLRSDLIYQGQRLCVPGGGEIGPQKPDYADHGKPEQPQGPVHGQPGYGVPGTGEAPLPGQPGYSGVPVQGQPGYVAPGYSGAAPPAPPPGYEVTPATATAPAVVVVPAIPQWVGSQTASNPDPDEITTLLVMTHDAKDLNIVIQSCDGKFTARGVSGVYFEFSWIPTFAFRFIPGGDYLVWIENKPSQIAKVHVDPGFRTLVEFKYEIVSVPIPPTPGGWIGDVVRNTSGIKPLGVASILQVRTGAIGNIIRVTAGTFEGKCVTGTKVELGPGACEMGGLNAGTYRVFLDGTDIAVDIYLDGVGTAQIDFRHV
jgi:LysM repeat protein